MADATLQISEASTGSAPHDYTVPPAQQFTLMGVRAVFDGTAAAAFVPVLQLISDSGRVMAQTKGDPVAAGGSADVTFAPFLESTAAGGSGIQFDTYPQAGNFLYTESTGTIDHATALVLHGRFPALSTGAWQSFGTVFVDSGGDDIGIVQPAGGSIDIIATKGSHAVLNTEAWEWFHTGSFVQISADSDITIQTSLAADITIQAGGTGHLIFPGLPVVNPGGSGRVWNNGGVLSIT